MCRLIPMNVGNREILVADIKQKYIPNIVDAARECDMIDRVVLFGSSLQERCNESSDMDLAVFGNLPPSRALTSGKYQKFATKISSYDNFSQTYDILYFKTDGKDNSPILEDVSKGEELYVRQA